MHLITGMPYIDVTVRRPDNTHSNAHVITTSPHYVSQCTSLYATILLAMLGFRTRFRITNLFHMFGISTSVK